MADVRVVLVDDHPIWRTGVREDLGDGFEVVGEASTAEEAIKVITETAPDLVVCDLHLPGSGITVVKACSDSTSIVMLTVSEAETDLLDAVGAGAVGYLVKSTSPKDLKASLMRAARGEPVFSPELASLVLGEFRRLAKVVSPGQQLTDREREVLQRVARGHSYKEIAEELFISDKTVDNHVRNILQKLHLSRKPELIRYAMKHGLD